MGRGDAYQAQGQGGYFVLDVANTTTPAGQTFRWLLVLNDAVFDTVAEVHSVGDIGGVTIPAGVGIGGIFTNAVLISGVVLAYYS